MPTVGIVTVTNTFCEGNLLSSLLISFESQRTTNPVVFANPYKMQLHGDSPSSHHISTNNICVVVKDGVTRVVALSCKETFCLVQNLSQSQSLSQRTCCINSCCMTKFLGDLVFRTLLTEALHFIHAHIFKSREMKKGVEEH